MFTGIIEELGTVTGIVKAAHSSQLRITGSRIFDDLSIGDSVATNGVCLTVAGLVGHSFTADVMHETLEKSTLGLLHVNSMVNLERAMAANGRFGGHIVSGHIDGTGTITEIRKDSNAIWYTIACGPELLRSIVLKGSVALDGISLTVATLTKQNFSVSIIPHTKNNTILGIRSVGDKVNIENDIIGKYVERLLGIEHGKTQGIKNNVTTSSVTWESLAHAGFL